MDDVMHASEKAGFKASYAGQGFYSFRDDGWPDYVTMHNSGDAMSGAYESRDYLSASYFAAFAAERDGLIRDLWICLRHFDSGQGCGICPRHDECGHDVGAFAERMEELGIKP